MTTYYYEVKEDRPTRSFEAEQDVVAVYMATKRACLAQENLIVLYKEGEQGMIVVFEAEK